MLSELSMPDRQGAAERSGKLSAYDALDTSAKPSKFLARIFRWRMLRHVRGR